MANIPLKLACWEYDRTRPLIDGRVRPQSIELDITLMRPQQAFQAMLHGREFDIAEMSLANYTSLKAQGNCPFVAIPVMLSKMFRHSCIYVRADAGIRSPSDLKSKRAGTAQFTSTGVVNWAVPARFEDRKSTRLNSSHSSISYAVFCLKKKKRE